MIFHSSDDAIEILARIRYKNHTRNTDCRTAEVACGVNMTSYRGRHMAEKRIGVQDVKAAETIRAT